MADQNQNPQFGYDFIPSVGSLYIVQFQPGIFHIHYHADGPDGVPELHSYVTPGYYPVVAVRYFNGQYDGRRVYPQPPIWPQAPANGGAPAPPVAENGANNGVPPAPENGVHGWFPEPAILENGVNGVAPTPPVPENGANNGVPPAPENGVHVWFPALAILDNGVNGVALAPVIPENGANGVAQAPDIQENGVHHF